MSFAVFVAGHFEMYVELHFSWKASITTVHLETLEPDLCAKRQWSYYSWPALMHSCQTGFHEYIHYVLSVFKKISDSELKCNVLCQNNL